MPISRTLVLALLCALLIAACAHRSPFDSAQGDKAGAAQGDTNGKIQVATTISTLNSFVQGVGGEYVSVKNIVPIGASPETFAPAPQDVATVADANLLVENGAGLESWLDRLLHDARSRDLRLVVCTAGLPVKNANPHLWMDPVYAKACVNRIRDAQPVNCLHAQPVNRRQVPDHQFQDGGGQGHHGQAEVVDLEAEVDGVPAAYGHAEVGASVGSPVNQSLNQPPGRQPDEFQPLLDAESVAGEPAEAEQRRELRQSPG